MAKCSETQVLTITTTVASMDDARALARSLVEARLAACVQLEPVAASFYRWEGKLCDEPEVRLAIKTMPALARSIQDFFEANHPYDLPQFVAVTAAATAAYAEWVRQQTT